MNNTTSKFHDLRQQPLLTVKDIQTVLQLGRTATYDFLNNNPPFRVLHVNHSIRVPSSDFFKWIDG